MTISDADIARLTRAWLDASFAAKDAADKAQFAKKVLTDAIRGIPARDEREAGMIKIKQRKGLPYDEPSEGQVE